VAAEGAAAEPAVADSVTVADVITFAAKLSTMSLSGASATICGCTVADCVFVDQQTEKPQIKAFAEKKEFCKLLFAFRHCESKKCFLYQARVSPIVFFPRKQFNRNRFEIIHVEPVLLSL
jgi:hypothetical protein